MKGMAIKQRAAALTAVLDKLYDPFGKEDNITDMLTDLRHLCLVKNWDFFRCDRLARDHASVEQFHNSIVGAEKLRKEATRNEKVTKHLRAKANSINITI